MLTATLAADFLRPLRAWGLIEVDDALLPNRLFLPRWVCPSREVLVNAIVLVGPLRGGGTR